jgi:cellobiose phosphorylase
MIAGKDALLHGEAKNSWLTGSASWNYVAITQWILGIRPTYEGLEISPVIPTFWKCFDAVRDYRGVHYVITVERVGLGNGIRLEVQGEQVEGTVVPIPTPGTLDVRVSVRVG